MSSATPIEFWKIKKFKKKSNQSVSSLLPPEINKQLSEFERKRVTHNILSEKLSLYKSATELKEHVEKFYGSKIVLFNTIQNAAYFANYLKAKVVMYYICQLRLNLKIKKRLSKKLSID